MVQMSSKYSRKKTIVQPPLKGLKNENEHLSIDETDRKILKLLTWDSRLSYREIARQLKLSTGTIIERLKKLKTSGVITGYSVNIDPQKLGYELVAIIDVIAAKGMFLEAAEEISKYPNVHGVYAVSGTSDAVVVAKFKEPDELNEFLKKLNMHSDVIRTNTHVVLKVIKEDFRTII